MRMKRRAVAASGAHTKRWWKRPIYKIFSISVRALICHILFLFIRLLSCTRRLDVWESAFFSSLTYSLADNANWIIAVFYLSWMFFRWLVVTLFVSSLLRTLIGITFFLFWPYWFSFFRNSVYFSLHILSIYFIHLELNVCSPHPLRVHFIRYVCKSHAHHCAWCIETYFVWFSFKNKCSAATRRHVCSVRRTILNWPSCSRTNAKHMPLVYASIWCDARANESVHTSTHTRNGLRESVQRSSERAAEKEKSVRWETQQQMARCDWCNFADERAEHEFVQ